MRGLIHLYCGDGKGKTTAAVGLAVRAAGAGRKVLFVQFFKDGSSSEIRILRALPGVEVRVSEQQHGFVWDMDDEAFALCIAGLYTASARCAGGRKGRLRTAGARRGGLRLQLPRRPRAGVA